MTDQERLELTNILGALICFAFPDAIKMMAACYDEISKGTLDMLVKHGLQDDIHTEKILGNTLMHIMRENMADKLTEKEKIDG